MGVVNLISAVKPALQSRLVLIDGVVPLLVRHGTRVTSALAGFTLILLASSLLRRKRTAWILTVIVLFVSIVTHLLKGLDFEEASLGLFLLIVLVVFRHSFHASSDRPSVRQGISVLVIAFLFTLTYGAAGFYLLDRHFRVHYSLLDALRQTVVMFSSFYYPGPEPLTGFGRYFAGSIYVIGLVTVGFALIMLIRPVLVRDPATAEERMRAEGIVQKYGRTFLARAALFEDKSYYFGPGETVVAYAASGRGAMALGDPIGPDSQIAEAVKGFLDFCSRNDWTPAFASVLPDHLDAYRKAGMDALCIGYEAIVHLDKFSLQGGENKGIRYSINRMEKNGYTATVYQPPLDDHLMETLHSISDAWLTLHHGGEMRFSDGWFHDSYIRNGPVIVVQTVDGSPTAFANLVPEYQKNELSIDLMRHNKNADHGTMEYLFVKMLLWAKENGYDTFSLGLSAIVGVGEKPEDPRVERALHTISEYISRFYNFRGLHEFKEKFHPCWAPRYLAYPGPASLPLVLTTMLRVHSGNDFLWKFLRK
jgi:phosphatidylglycerol lysyltransferase